MGFESQPPKKGKSALIFPLKTDIFKDASSFSLQVIVYRRDMPVLCVTRVAIRYIEFPLRRFE